MRRPAAPAEGLTPLRLAKLALLAFFLLGLPALLDIPYVTSIYISALMFGIFGAIYDLMIGYAGLSNFGFAGFLAVGAYTSALGAVHDGISPWLGLLLGGLAAALVGLVTGVITLRLRGLYLGLITWFVGEGIRFSISNTPGYTRGVLGLSVPPFPDILGIDFSRGGDALAYYYLLIVLGAAIMAAMHLLVRSRIGLAFKAIREDQLATESLGLSATKYKLINFVVAMFFTGVMGAFYAHYLGILTPTPEEFGVPRTVEILTLAYVGGRGTLWGSLFAAFLLIGFQEYFRGLGAYRLVLFGVLLILVMLFARKGLAGLKKFVW
ncbi:MAG TPA: branched-chain amino acid ABC transporter permease [Alphaproteobacteria bacterium]|nr:branched-chain amino acid ABC transporter permease [Alphaproteobacteria bacterium]